MRSDELILPMVFHLISRAKRYITRKCPYTKSSKRSDKYTKISICGM
jgi:hypothetical protein